LDYQLYKDAWWKEIEAEAKTTRKCLAKIPAEKFDFKPHPSSMPMGYLLALVAEIPKWIAVMIEAGEIDFASFQHDDPKTSEDLLRFFDANMQAVQKAIQQASVQQLDRTFQLKSKGQILLSEKTAEYIGPTINHWVHHRGQLTVYMRICEIPVPSIYGPSGDEKEY
jgi:uncharacterized damage-inducible protein DinB